jgi:hypothetical protein
MNALINKTNFLLFIARRLNVEVIFEFCSFFKFTSCFENIFRREGNKVNEIKKDTIKQN